MRLIPICIVANECFLFIICVQAFTAGQIQSMDSSQALAVTTQQRSQLSGPQLTALGQAAGDNTVAAGTVTPKPNQPTVQATTPAATSGIRVILVYNNDFNPISNSPLAYFNINTLCYENSWSKSV